MEYCRVPVALKCGSLWHPAPAGIVPGFGEIGQVTPEPVGLVNVALTVHVHHVLDGKELFLVQEVDERGVQGLAVLLKYKC